MPTARARLERVDRQTAGGNGRMGVAQAVDEKTLTAAALAVGNSAPPFVLERAPDQPVALTDFRGRSVVLAFYPGDWTPVCNDQLVDLTARLGAFRRRGAEVLGISVDSASSHQAFAEARQIGFPLLADFHPKGEIARAFGVYSDAWGIAHRALFLLDANGVVRWRQVVPPWVNPGALDVLGAVDRLTAEGMSG